MTVIRPAELTTADVRGRTLLVDLRRETAQLLDRLSVAGRLGAATVIAVTDSRGLTAVDPRWDVDDLVLDTASRAELAARLRLRRQRPRPAPAPELPDRLVVGDLVIDRSEHQVTIDGRAVSLTFREHRLLAHLAGHVGRVVSRDELMRAVWERPDAAGTRTVDVHVARLRRKLGPRHGDLLHTVRKVGYRLSQPKHVVSAA